MKRRRITFGEMLMIGAISFTLVVGIVSIGTKIVQFAGWK